MLDVNRVFNICDLGSRIKKNKARKLIASKPLEFLTIKKTKIGIFSDPFVPAL